MGYSANAMGRPDVPDPVDDLILITRFTAYLGASYMTADKHGNIVIKLTLPDEERWKALLLDKAEGLMLHIDVSRIPTPDTDEEIANLIGLE